MTHSTTLNERQQYWLKHIRACDASGQTSLDYARAQGINIQSLYSARRNLARKGTPLPLQSGRLQRVQQASSARLPDSQWHVKLPNGAVVAFSGTVDAGTLG